MSHKVLILEDNNLRVKFFINMFYKCELKITEDAKEAIRYLENYTFNYLFLDNDLGMGNGEGVDVARFLNNHPENHNNSSTIVIHSWNSPAAIKMYDLLPCAIIAPFKTNKFYEIKLDI